MIEATTELATAEAPIACLLSGEELRQRGEEEVLPLLASRVETRKLPDGYALRFPGDATVAAKLLSFITEERACCPFFTFELRFEPPHTSIWLHLRGPEGTTDFVADILAQAPEQ